MEDDIAVVGVGCNFPGGEGLDSFWKVLLEGKNCAVEIPAERFDKKFWYHVNDSQPGKTQTTKAALIEGFNEFDHKFFGITEAEADFMDPQQKLLLQCTYRALEDGGVAMEDINGSRTGVYIGLMNRDYEMLRNNSAATITHYNGTGTAMSVAANRISFTFNLTGPSFTIDSACSSSLVALHVACQAIKQGDCEMALCGGVNCIIEPRVFVALSKAKMISPEGTSKPFSSKADGYGRGEGCGVILLKPLKKALNDFNKIWGIIGKTAVNQDGHSVAPITKPSKTQQEDLLKRIYSDSDIANIQYIEAHGTGTPVGDPTEAGSISNIITKTRPPGSEMLWIGSVKGNIGHTESAAGVAGLIKVLLMMKHETIVPSVFYSEDSANVHIKGMNLNIPTRTEKWKNTGSVERLAGVNSFGFGGTNAHVIIREYNCDATPTQIPKGGPNLFLISASSQKSLIQSIADTHQRLSNEQRVDLQALSYTSTCRRTHYKHKYRKAFQISSLSDLKQKLTSTQKVESVRANLQVVFVFCGNGVAYRGMCSQLMREFPVFREKVREVESLFQTYNTVSISKCLAECDDDDFNKPSVVQPLLFAIQVGIATLLKHWGVRADVMLGHSVGEVAAAHCSGLLSLENAVKVLYYRSTFQSKVTGGKMLVISNMCVENVLKTLPDFSGRICVAAFNSPRSCTLSGDEEAIQILHERLKITFADTNLFLHVLDVPAAYHSHMMDPVLGDIERQIGLLDAKKTDCKLFSTVTGDICSDGDFSTGTYWAKNIRKPVLFEQALHAAIKHELTRNLVFVEIGPRRVLQRNICETLGKDTVVLSCAQPEKDSDTIHSTLAKLFELGVNIDWHKLYSGYETLPTEFPVYQFDNSTKEQNFEALRKGNETSTYSPHSLISQIKEGGKEFLCNLSVESTPYLWEHKNNSISIIPGAFYVELAYASLMESLRPKTPVSQLHLSVSFESMLTLSSHCQQLKVIVEHADKRGSFIIQSSVATHASGTYTYTESQLLLEESTICLDVISQRCKLVMTTSEIYSILSQAGFEYGPIFKQLHDVCFGNEYKEALTTIRVPHELRKYIHDYYIHPVILDYFLQMTAVVIMGQVTAQHGFPSGVRNIAVSGPLQEEMVMYLQVTQETADFLDVCGCFSTSQGKILVELKGVRISFLGRCSDISQLFFFHNEIVTVDEEKDVQNCEIKAIVFEDGLSITKTLKRYLHPASVVVKSKEEVLSLLNNNVDVENVLFIVSENVTHLSCEKVLDCLASYCETLRQIVLTMKKRKKSCTIHVITYRSTESIVDFVSPGFVLSGMTRACMAEMSGLSFQLIDLMSVTFEDIETLAHVVKNCKQQEVRIMKGQVTVTKITRTPVEERCLYEGHVDSVHPRDFVLQTADPYRMTHLSAISANGNPVQEKSVEVMLTNVCMHSSDYFPVSTSHLNFGRTFYWNNHTAQSHNVLALDFSGIITSVGKDVTNLRVGDHVASCYPVVATKKIVIPEAACYSTNRLPFLKETPCVSFFILAWEILQRILSKVKGQNKKLAIISSNSASALVKVLALTGSRSGWNVSSRPHFRVEPSHLDQSHVFIFLPPFDHSWQKNNETPINDQEKHIIFVHSGFVSVSVPALKSEHIHVHNIDVANVLQKAKLNAQNGDIVKWLMSLGFDRASLPLRKELYQLEEPQSNMDSESYFTTNTVQQIDLQHEDVYSPESNISLHERPEELFKKSCIYIVTGGLSGLGLETVKFIAHNGGGYVATLSRRTPSDKIQSEMDLLQKRYGVVIINVRCDVSVSTQVVDMISMIRRRFPSCPIKGVFHSAAVLHDALIEGLDEKLFRKVLQPKVSGALNLHYSTLHDKLDFFVCYSSISSFLGNASQCNYAAANSFLDTFCHYRRNLGLAAQSINWGPLNLGLLQNKDHFQKFLESKGMMTMDVCEVHEAFKKCLLMNRPQQVICKFNFKNLNIHVLSQNASLRERLSALVEVELKDEIQNDPGVQCLKSIHECVSMTVSDITNVSVDELDDESTLCALGIDSMLAMTLQNKIYQETGVNIPLVIILDPNTTLASLISDVLNTE